MSIEKAISKYEASLFIFRGCGFDDHCSPDQWCVDNIKNEKGYECVHKSTFTI